MYTGCPGSVCRFSVPLFDISNRFSVKKEKRGKKKKEKKGKGRKSNNRKIDKIITQQDDHLDGSFDVICEEFTKLSRSD